MLVVCTCTRVSATRLFAAFCYRDMSSTLCFGAKEDAVEPEDHVEEEEDPAGPFLCGWDTFLTNCESGIPSRAKQTKPD